MEKELANAIEIVADQLGIAVEHIYGTFVSAQPVIGVIEVVFMAAVALSTTIFTIFAYRALKSHLTDDKGDWDNDESPVMALALSVMAAMVFAMVFSLFASGVRSALLKIFCPEYSAIREILSLAMGS